MDNAIEVVVEDNLWEHYTIETIAVTVFSAIEKKLALKTGPYELDVLACDDARITVLNAEFRGKQMPTNVLSWPSFDLSPERAGQYPSAPPDEKHGDPFTHIGDIAIAYQTCMKEAKAGGITPQHHITHLLIHGILHLLGYDHETDADATIMENIEIDILAGMGIGNPYQNV